MGIFSRQQDFILNFDKLVFSQLKDSLNANGEHIENFIVEKQLFDKGINAKAEKIRPFYADATVRRKRKLGQPVDRVTLRDSEAMHQSLKVSGDPYELVVTVDTPYAKYVLKRYGNSVILPTVETMKAYFENQFINDLKTKINEYR